MAEVWIVPIYRTKLLNRMIQALKAFTPLNTTHIYSPGDWPSQPDETTVLQVGRLVNEQKMSLTRGQAEFNTTAYVTVDGRLSRTTGEQALRDIEHLSWKVEQAILTDFYLNGMLQQFSSVKTVQEIDSSTGLHVAQCTIEFGMEFFQGQEEYYTPTVTAEITSVDLALDSQNIYDPSGTYTGTPVTEEFPASVVPAPRVQGPDGRAEGYIVVDVNQS